MSDAQVTVGLRDPQWADDYLAGWVSGDGAQWIDGGPPTCPIVFLQPTVAVILGTDVSVPVDASTVEFSQPSVSVSIDPIIEADASTIVFSHPPASVAIDIAVEVAASTIEFSQPEASVALSMDVEVDPSTVVFSQPAASVPGSVTVIVGMPGDLQWVADPLAQWVDDPLDQWTDGTAGNIRIGQPPALVSIDTVVEVEASIIEFSQPEASVALSMDVEVDPSAIVFSQPSARVDQSVTVLVGVDASEWSDLDSGEWSDVDREWSDGIAACGKIVFTQPPIRGVFPNVEEIIVEVGVSTITLSDPPASVQIVNAVNRTVYVGVQTIHFSQPRAWAGPITVLAVLLDSPITGRVDHDSPILTALDLASSIVSPPVVLAAGIALAATKDSPITKQISLASAIPDAIEEAA